MKSLKEQIAELRAVGYKTLADCVFVRPGVDWVF